MRIRWISKLKELKFKATDFVRPFKALVYMYTSYHLARSGCQRRNSEVCTENCETHAHEEVSIDGLSGITSSMISSFAACATIRLSQMTSTMKQEKGDNAMSTHDCPLRIKHRRRTRARLIMRGACSHEP
jgi:hypothetical protein